MSPVKRMSLDGYESLYHPQSKGILMFVKNNPNVIFEGGISWGTLHALTEEQVGKLNEQVEGYKVTIYKGLWFLNYDLFNILTLRGWYLSDDIDVYEEEKVFMVDAITKLLDGVIAPAGHLQFYRDVLHLLEQRTTVSGKDLYSVQLSFN